jgi:hypothetical protein
LCWHLEPEDITTSQNHLEEALLRRLVQALPQAASPIFLGDRALGRASFLQFLQQLPIDMGGRIEFVVRLKGEVKIEWQGQRWLLQDLPLQRGRVHWLPGVRYRADGAVTVNLVVFWDWQMREPWYLATSLPQGRKALRCYGRRMGEEEMFRDDKHHLGLRGMAKVQSSARKERLLFALMLA